MQVTISERDVDNIVVIDYESVPGRAKLAYQKTLKRLGETVSIKGFRKGKVPTKILEEYFGFDAIKAEVMTNEFVSELFEEVFKVNNLNVVYIDKIEKIDFDNPESTVSIKAQVELFPNFVLPDFSSFSLQIEIPKLDLEKERDQLLEEILRSQTVFEETDQALSWEDEIVIDFEGEYKDEQGNWQPKQEMCAKAYQTIMQKNKFIEGFLEPLLGMKAGESKTIEVRFPEDYHSEDLAGRDAKFSITIKQVKKALKPVFDQAFVEKFDHKSKEDFLASIDAEILKTRNEYKNQLRDQRIINELTKTVDINVSKKMIQRELEHDFYQYQKAQELSDEELKDYVANLNMQEEEDKAANKLKWGIIITSVIKEQKLEASLEDLQKEIARYNFPPGYSFENVDMKSLTSKLNLDVLSQKAVDYIANQINIDYIESDSVSPGQVHVHGPHCNH